MNMDFGKGVVNPKAGRKATNVFSKSKKSTSKRRSGTKARARYINDGTIEEPKFVWYAEIKKDDDNVELIPINKESVDIPFVNKGTDKEPKYLWKVIDLYCIPDTNPTYPPWYKKKDRGLRPKDKHIAKVINTYWCTIKPNLVIFGEIKDGEYYINHK